MSKFDKCTICTKSHGKSIEKTCEHYDKCVGEKEKGAEINGYLVRFGSNGLFGTYYMYASIKHNATLNDLDKFLKKYWCNCCGHLSQFINKDRDVCKKSNKVGLIGIGGKLKYEYDMGDTTEIYIELIKDYGEKENGSKQKCVLLFMKCPKILCECKETAKLIYGGEPICVNCKNKMELDEEETLYRIYDSPRTGICGYGIYGEDPPVGGWYENI